MPDTNNLRVGVRISYANNLRIGVAKKYETYGLSRSVYLCNNALPVLSSFSQGFMRAIIRCITSPFFRLRGRLCLYVGLISACACFTSSYVYAGTLYLPLHMSPEVEARVERLFVLAGMPIIKRPIAINDVIKALDKVEGEAPFLTRGLRFYLDRYNKTVGITHLNASISTGSNNSAIPHTLDNQRGLTTDDSWQGSFAGFWAVNDYIAVNLGARFKEQSLLSNKIVPEGSFISIGWDALQADIGYRAHWLGPFQESDMLFSTNVESLPGITLSNSEPFDFYNLRYEVAFMRMSESDVIESVQAPSANVTGYPKLFSAHLSLEPTEGLSVGLNRLVQFGGADRDESSSAIFNAFFNTSNEGNERVDTGNQLTSINTRYIFNHTVPFAVYMELANESTSSASDVAVDNSAFMWGVHLPQLPYNLDVTVESAQWKNGWYVNGHYGDGLTHFGNVIGHWAANYRLLNDARGLSTYLVKAIWDDYNGTAFTGRIKTISSESKNANETNGFEFNIEVAHAYNDSIIGLTFTTGKNILNERYSNVSGFIRW